MQCLYLQSILSHGSHPGSRDQKDRNTDTVHPGRFSCCVLACRSEHIYGLDIRGFDAQGGQFPLNFPGQSSRTICVRFAHWTVAADYCFITIVVVIIVIFGVVIINIAIGIVVIITHVVQVAGLMDLLMIISSVESIAFIIALVGMPIAVISHVRIALT
jgi:hypothetical protein